MFWWESVAGITREAKTKLIMWILKVKTETVEFFYFSVTGIWHFLKNGKLIPWGSKHLGEILSDWRDLNCLHLFAIGTGCGYF